jgi:inosine-uridine nucleoside N-ribohydrolase
MGTWLLTSQVERLRSGDPLCRELARMIDIWTQRPRRTGVPAEYACLLHDPLAVACTVDRRFVTSTTARVTVAMHQGHVRTFIDPATGQDAEIVTSVDWRGFGAFWLETVMR